MPLGLQTRFAPAPTGYLHLGHVANAVVTWRVARLSGGSVILRIENHDRQRCRPEFETALLDDLAALGFEPDAPPVASFRAPGSPSPYRQSDNDDAYSAAVNRLDASELVYACECSRSTFVAWEASHGRTWLGPGCPGACAARELPRTGAGISWRVAVGGGDEAWTDEVRGPQSGPVAKHGDPAIRDRHGNWTYALCVVVDDLRHEIDLVIRGEDLLESTALQIRLGRILGRELPPRFLHHPLIRRPDGRKLSKADGSTAVREQLAAGTSASYLREAAQRLIGLQSQD